MALNITIEYCSNYNGVHIIDTAADDECKHPNTNALSDAICERASTECNEHVGFYGDTDELEEFAVAKAKELMGDVTVTFEINEVDD